MSIVSVSLVASIPHLGQQVFIHSVFVVKGDIVEQRFVETGIVGDRDYEILSGLQEGEEIVTGSFVAISRDLYDGAKIKVKDKSNNKQRSSRKRG